MKRKDGYYWCFYENQWEIFFWNGEYFCPPWNEQFKENDPQITQIDETPITRNKN